MSNEPQQQATAVTAEPPSYFEKMKGRRRDKPLPDMHPFDVFVSWLGAFLGISTVAILTVVYGLPMLVASFGASAVLVYGAPDAPFSQPRNVVLGHTFSATVGVTMHTLFGLTWWAMALAVSLAIVVMILTKTTHPPAGATALVGCWSQMTWSYIFAPVFVGAIILVIVGIFTNNISPRRSYPKYWI